MPRRILFYRNFEGYSGGHGKVFDYFRHSIDAGWDARVYLSPTSLRDASNPWMQYPDRIVAHYDPQEAEVLFLAGLDWQALPSDAPGKPVINLIQHVRHARADDPRYAFLDRPALRICVSQPVADAILATGRVNGAVRVIEAALDLPRGLRSARSRSGIVIDAIKQPKLGHRLAHRLRALGRSPYLLDTPIARTQYLALLAAAEIAVTLPHAEEGFYLPGLEAMALGCAVVLPDCIGNRAYLRAQSNALVPALNCESLLAAVLALEDPTLRARLVAAGRATAARFDRERERLAWQTVLAAWAP